MEQQRATWTDERLNDLAESMRIGFARVDEDIREIRLEIAGLRAEMHEGFAALRQEIHLLRTQMFAFQGAIIIALIGVIGAIVARGA